MRTLETAMREVDVGWDDSRRTIYTTMPTEFETISSGIAEVTGGAGDPAQTIAGVTGLAVPGLMKNTYRATPAGVAHIAKALRDT